MMWHLQIRDKIFKKLRELSPAKLDSKDSGHLISIITSDIELLEVFYAHTISPVLIACIHTFVLAIIIWRINIKLAVILIIFHFIMAIVVPVITSARSKNLGAEQRNSLSKLNSSILDTFKGIDQCIQYDFGEKRKEQINKNNREFKNISSKLSKVNGENFGLSNAVILLGNAVMLFVSTNLYLKEQINLAGLFVSVVLFVSSFGPVSALSALANNLIITFACGQRVMDLLDEEPLVKEQKMGKDLVFDNLEVNDLSFSYSKDVPVLENINLNLKLNEVIGIKGKSGCGKSTLLKLIMHFYKPSNGEILINGTELDDINSNSLWDNISYVTQSTHIFKGTIYENLRIAKENATDEEIIEACKKASIHDFIETLPKKYDTYLDDTNINLSTGERQRLSVARAFLRDSKLILLDEPTANIDAINEGMILKSISEESNEKGIIILSHKDSSLRITKKIIEFK